MYFLWYPSLVARCCSDCWRCRCAAVGECVPAPFPPTVLLPPLEQWTSEEVAAFLRSLGPKGSRQTCPATCPVQALFSAKTVQRASQVGLNGSHLFEILRSQTRTPHHKLLHGAVAETADPMFLRRLVTALRQEVYGQPEALWFGGAQRSPRRGQERGVALLESLVRSGWTARIIRPRSFPRMSYPDSLEALNREFPSAVRLVDGIACPHEASTVPIYTRLQTADCGGILRSSVAAELVLSTPSCRAVGSCVRCVKLATKPHGQHVGAVFVDAVGAEQSLMLHRFLSSPLYDPSQPPRLLRFGARFRFARLPA